MVTTALQHSIELGVGLGIATILIAWATWWLTEFGLDTRAIALLSVGLTLGVLTPTDWAIDELGGSADRCPKTQVRLPASTTPSRPPGLCLNAHESVDLYDGALRVSINSIDTSDDTDNGISRLTLRRTEGGEHTACDFYDIKVGNRHGVVGGPAGTHTYYVSVLALTSGTAHLVAERTRAGATASSCSPGAKKPPS